MPSYRMKVSGIFFVEFKNNSIPPINPKCPQSGKFAMKFMCSQADIKRVPTENSFSSLRLFLYIKGQPVIGFLKITRIGNRHDAYTSIKIG